MKCWKDLGSEISNACGLLQLPIENLLPCPSIEPWWHPEGIEFHPSLNRPVSRETPPSLKLQITMETIRSLPPADYIVYTDGSATNAEKCGSGALIINVNTEEEHSLSHPAGNFGSSFRAESVALLHALTWLKLHQAQGNIRILTDSKSLVVDLAAGVNKTKSNLRDNIWTHLKDLSANDRTIIIQWIPGHCGLPGNESADRLANIGSLMDQSGIQIDYLSAKAKVKRYIKEVVLRPRLVHYSQPDGLRPPPQRDKEKGLTR